MSNSNSQSSDTPPIFSARAAEKLRDKYRHDPAYSARFLEDILALIPEVRVSPKDLPRIREIVSELKREIDANGKPAGDGVGHFRKEIIDYYIPKQLVDAIIANGGIPKDSVETQIGVGFIDVADYSFLAKFLSPKENQILLNGLYTSFAHILKKKGGYLNKTEGDSLMFHFGGLIDPQVKNLNPRETLNYISTELFYTCIEMQRICYLFNEANPVIIDRLKDEEEKKTVQDAFDIIRFMRNDDLMANSFNALFQIRIRIGANVGEVSIGNFGPPGSKHWDVIGVAVIDAKRMESTAPVGGLRISESFYQLLEQNGIVERYYRDFQKEAKTLNSYFRDITREELFSFGSVILKDKRNVTFRTYSVQVNPGLPEAIADQITLLLEKGGIGAEKIVDLIKYYRGNKHVIQAVEDLFRERNIRLRKGKMVYYLFPEKYRRSLRILGGDRSKVEVYIDRKYLLFDVLKTLGEYQDRIKIPYHTMDENAKFQNYEQFLNQEFGNINNLYKKTIKNSIHNTYFFHVIFPLIFKSIKASILEYQSSSGKASGLSASDSAVKAIRVPEDDLEDLEEVEAI